MLYKTESPAETERKGWGNGRLEGQVTEKGTALSERSVKEEGQSRKHSGWEELCRVQCPGLLWTFVLQFLREVKSLTLE